MQRIVKIALIITLFFIFLNSLVFIGLAVYRSLYAYILIAQGKMEERPGVYILESLDSFLIAIFFLVFAIGIAKLFLSNTSFIKGYDLPWLNIKNFSDLKLILWEMLLTTLLVFFGVSLVVHEEQLDWTLLIIPASVLMLAIAYKFLKQGH
jgi:uncharacterized membrane protein YqhA